MGGAAQPARVCPHPPKYIVGVSSIGQVYACGVHVGQLTKQFVHDHGQATVRRFGRPGRGGEPAVLTQPRQLVTGPSRVRFV